MVVLWLSGEPPTMRSIARPPERQTRDVLLGKVFPRRAQVIDTGTLRALLSP